MTHGYPIIPDILVLLFCLAWIVKLTSKPEVKPVPAPVKKSIYPIPRGRMS